MEQEYITPGGIRVYYDQDTRLHSFCISLYLMAGPMYETEEDNGISHFFEHIVFRNIHHRMNETLYQTLDKLGLEFNAATYKELIEFRITGAPMHFAEAAHILAQIFAPLTLPEDEVDVERRRIKAEIREEEEEESLSYFAKQIIWKGTPLSFTITGPGKTLKRIGRERLSEFQAQVLVTDNLFFYVTGSFGEEDIRYLAGEADRYHLPVGTLSRVNTAPVPETFFHRKPKLYIKKGKVNAVCLGIDIDAAAYSFAELQILYDILFEGDFCRIHQALSEKTGYVYSYDSWLEQYTNLAHIHLRYEVKPVNLAASVEAVMEVLCSLKEDIGNALDYVRPFYIDNAELVLDQVEEYNWMRAYENHILKVPYADIEEQKELYRRVTPERITEICREIFAAGNLTLAIEMKKDKLDRKALEQMWNNCLVKL